MKHVHVVSTSSHFEYDRLRLTKNALISLEQTLQHSLNTKKEIDRADIIKDYKERVIGAFTDAKLYLDSGGYSIIKGDVGVDKVLSFIDEYHIYMEKNGDLFDYIFSLDIPIGDGLLKEYDTIYNLNKISLQRTLEVLERKPELKEKFYFIQHFKTKDHFRIWNRLEKELNINDHIIHRSIGGLVGLKSEIRHFKRTTFLPMIFRSFFNFVQIYNKEFDLESFLEEIDKGLDKHQWRASLKMLYKKVDGIDKYITKSLPNRIKICEDLIKNSQLKKYAKDSQTIDKLSLYINSILDDYFGQLQDTPDTNKKKLYELVIDKVLKEEDLSIRRRKQIKTFAGKKQEFRLHVLGVSNIQDRYIIALIEHLLNQHCEINALDMEIKITYDSIFYTTQALKNFKNLKYFRDDLSNRPLEEISNSDLKKVYPDKFDLVRAEIGKERLLYADTFTPLNISSNINVDKYICNMMEMKSSFANKLVKALDKNDDGTKVFNSLAQHLAEEEIFLKDLAEDPFEPVLNKKHLPDRLSDDLCAVIYFYLLIKRNDLDEINKAVEGYVDQMDYPYPLIK
jgi:hypothetical protein